MNCSGNDFTNGHFKGLKLEGLVMSSLYAPLNACLATPNSGLQILARNSLFPSCFSGLRTSIYTARTHELFARTAVLEHSLFHLQDPRENRSSGHSSLFQTLETAPQQLPGFVMVLTKEISGSTNRKAGKPSHPNFMLC